MTEQNLTIAAEASQGQRPKPLPLSKAEVVSQLSGCLTLVRPVSMSDDMASEWLAVAANEVLGFAEQRPARFKAACERVRRECSHHGQIVPTILKGARYDWEPKDKIFKSQEQIEADARRYAIECSKTAGLIEGATKALTAK